MAKALLRKVSVGYARGTRTRARILEVSIRLFGRKGYDGVTTREIAAESDVPPASLQYYFENKVGLYLACLDHVQRHSLDILGSTLDRVEALTVAQSDQGRLADIYWELFDAVIDFSVQPPVGPSYAMFALRRDFPSEALVAKPSGIDFLGPRINGCCARILTKISNGRIDGEMANSVAISINSQMFSVIIDVYCKEVMEEPEIQRLKELRKFLKTQVIYSVRSHFY
ncbi:MAG: AcrR family transcriptional regulator [Afipia broomeae]|jgi:AcrR family transcriptional regulator